MGWGAAVAAAIAGHRQVRSALPDTARALGLAGVAGVAVLAYPIWAALRGPGHIVGPIQPVAEAYRGDQMVAVRRSGSLIIVSRTGDVPMAVDLTSPSELGATWLGPFLDPESGPGASL